MGYLICEKSLPDSVVVLGLFRVLTDTVALGLEKSLELSLKFLYAIFYFQDDFVTKGSLLRQKTITKCFFGTTTAILEIGKDDTDFPLKQMGI